MTRSVAILVGSLRREAYSRKLANALVELFPDSFDARFPDIGGLPLYNEDLEASSPPEAWLAFRDEIRAAAAVLFVTPEYNRSVPGGLKNALDVGSRPYGKSAWEGKPAGVVSVSPGAIGAFGAHHHLRQSLVFLNMPAMQAPEAYVGHASKLFSERGELVSDSTRDFLRTFVRAFEKWVDRHVTAGTWSR